MDLNSDLGEGYGQWSMGDDTALLDIVTSANIACGFHAGDPTTMRRAVEAAIERGVAIGAHAPLAVAEQAHRPIGQCSPQRSGRGCRRWRTGRALAAARTCRPAALV